MNDSASVGVSSYGDPLRKDAHPRMRPRASWEPIPGSALRGSLVDRFEQTVDRFPEREALRAADVRLDDAALDHAAHRVAYRILELRGAEPEAVAVSVAGDGARLALLLGVLKARKFYLAVDPIQPAERVAAQLESAAGPISTSLCCYRATLSSTRWRCRRPCTWSRRPAGG